MENVFDYAGDVGINEYGLVLLEAGTSFLQQELARRLGLDWGHTGHWRGVLRIHIELDGQDDRRPHDHVLVRDEPD